MEAADRESNEQEPQERPATVSPSTPPPPPPEEDPGVEVKNLGDKHAEA